MQGRFDNRRTQSERTRGEEGEREGGRDARGREEMGGERGDELRRRVRAIAHPRIRVSAFCFSFSSLRLIK